MICVHTYTHRRRMCERERERLRAAASRFPSTVWLAPRQRAKNTYAKQQLLAKVAAPHEHTEIERVGYDNGGGGGGGNGVIHTHTHDKDTNEPRRTTRNETKRHETTHVQVLRSFVCTLTCGPTRNPHIASELRLVWRGARSFPFVILSVVFATWQSSLHADGRATRLNSILGFATNDVVALMRFGCPRTPMCGVWYVCPETFGTRVPLFAYQARTIFVCDLSCV